MKNIFELPELLTLDGIIFGSSGDPEEPGDPPNSCEKGCDKGCGSGGCFPGSTMP